LRNFTFCVSAIVKRYLGPKQVGLNSETEVQRTIWELE